jgi:TRAP-type C4-dicarboxylate transport system substrate-binding protein
MEGDTMSTIPRVVAVTAVATLTLAGLAACTTQPSGPSEPVALTMFHIDGGADLDPAVDWFVEAVSEASDGMVSVEVVRGCCEDAVDIEEDLVGQVAAGGADLGWVGTRAFEGLGIDELLPLTAPFLVDGYGLQQAIIESDAAHSAVTAVGDAGVMGLALMPGQMRRPLAVQAPLVDVADWVGIPIASFHSSQSARAFEVLGAEPQDVTFEQRDRRIFDKSILALENSLTMQALNREDTLPYATANVALWPRLSALIAAPDSRAVSDAGVRQILLDAADAVAARTTDFVAIDQAAMVSACESGARFAAASAAQLDELRAAVKPIWEELAKGEATASLFAEIDKARAGSIPEPLSIPEACTGAAPSAEPRGSGDVSAVNGRWETPVYTYDGLVEAGISQQEARNAEGQFLLAFDDGDFELQATTPRGEVFGCVGDYSIDGKRITVNYEPGGDCGHGGVFFTADFTVDETSLTLSDMRNAIETDVYLFSSSPLTKVE